MTDPIELARTAAMVLCLVALLLAIIALSLRRIARALEKLAEKDLTVGVELSEDQQSNLFHQVGNIAWEAGRNFQHGMRTDR